MTEEYKVDFLLHCESLLSDRITVYNTELKELKASYDVETKSSAGDKYETAREMIHIEKGKILAQVSNLKKVEIDLKRVIQQKQKGSSAQFGSMIFTDKAVFLLGVPNGNVKFENKVIFCISLVAPIAKNIIGKSKGCKISLNGYAQTIKEIF